MSEWKPSKLPNQHRRKGIDENAKFQRSELANFRCFAVSLFQTTCFELSASRKGSMFSRICDGVSEREETLSLVCYATKSHLDEDIGDKSAHKTGIASRNNSRFT